MDIEKTKEIIMCGNYFLGVSDTKKQKQIPRKFNIVARPEAKSDERTEQNIVIIIVMIDYNLNKYFFSQTIF